MSETTEAAGSKVVMGQNNYGKSDVRLVKVFRDTERHELTDVRVDVTLFGDFTAAHVEGDNGNLLATDTMRNTVYALARDQLTGSVEDFGIKLVKHFVEAGPTVECARVRFTEHLWNRITVGGEEHDHSFVRASGEHTATVEGDGTNFKVTSGIDDLTVIKTTNSGWEGYLKERFTTLPETRDRILSTVIRADWLYNTTDPDYSETWAGVRQRILESFTDHYSPSVQNTLYLMGRAVLESFPQIERIRLSLPNRHHLLYDLERFGMANDNEIFHADAEPYGLIEGTVERGR